MGIEAIGRAGRVERCCPVLPKLQSFAWAARQRNLGGHRSIDIAGRRVFFEGVHPGRATEQRQIDR